MSATAPLAAPVPVEAPTASCEYLVSHGKCGAVGLFVAEAPLVLERGTRVVIASARGLELGSVLCAASARHGELLGHVAGRLVRRAGPDDDLAAARVTATGQALFEASRAIAQRLKLPIQIIDVDMLLDGQMAVLQFLGSAGDFAELIGAVERQFSLVVRLENLSLAPEPESKSCGKPGCGKPDCGRVEGGACSTCGSGGGCSSCGPGQTDLRPYFSHLRERMEARHRTPLL